MRFLVLSLVIFPFFFSNNIKATNKPSEPGDDDSCHEKLKNSGLHKHVFLDASFDRADANPAEALAAQWREPLISTESLPERVSKLAWLMNGLLSNGDYPGHELYRDAILFVATHREALGMSVQIHLPGGLGGNSDPFWNEVKATTRGTCHC